MADHRDQRAGIVLSVEEQKRLNPIRRGMQQPLILEAAEAAEMTVLSRITADREVGLEGIAKSYFILRRLHILTPLVLEAREVQRVDKRAVMVVAA
jgi:hypothetical protein